MKIMMKNSASLFVAYLFFMGIVLGQVMPLSGETSEKPFKGKMKEMIESAKTANDHKAIAKYYLEEEAKAKALVSEHQEMASWYKERRQINKTTIYVHNRKHCERLVKYYNSLAEEFKALAAEHEELAIQLK